MLDMKIHEPDIQILYPLLIHYSPEAAILYGYLKQLCEANGALKKHGEDAYYHFVIKRYEIELATGLSVGEQIDAETELIGADIVIGSSMEGERVQYFLYPNKEDSLRRFVYSKRWAWN